MIFKTLSYRYLHKWDSSIEGREKDIAQEWSERLSDLNMTQVKRGLKLWDKSWPPSCDEFKQCCVGNKKNQHGLTYVPVYYRHGYYIVYGETDEEKLKRRQKALTEIKKIKDTIR